VTDVMTEARITARVKLLAKHDDSHAISVA